MSINMIEFAICLRRLMQACEFADCTLTISGNSVYLKCKEIEMSGTEDLMEIGKYLDDKQEEHWETEDQEED